MKKILLIEDNIDLAENIATLLEKQGHLIHTAFNGEEGLKVILELHPDLVLCDILLPGINGYSVLKEIQKMENIIPPVFIFITAKNQRDELRKGMILGADDYITKPFTYEELLAAIKTQFEKRKSTIRRIDWHINNDGTPNGNSKQSNATDRHFYKTEPGYEEYVFLKSKKESGLYLIDDILVIKSLRDYTHIYLKGNKSFLLRRSMIEWEKKLPSNRFIRIHKQSLVNIKYVEKVELISSHRFLITISDHSKKLEVSQRYSRKMKKYFL